MTTRIWIPQHPSENPGMTVPSCNHSARWEQENAGYPLACWLSPQVSPRIGKRSCLKNKGSRDRGGHLMPIWLPYTLACACTETRDQAESCRVGSTWCLGSLKPGPLQAKSSWTLVHQGTHIGQTLRVSHTADFLSLKGSFRRHRASSAFDQGKLESAAPPPSPTNHSHFMVRTPPDC